MKSIKLKDEFAINEEAVAHEIGHGVYKLQHTLIRLWFWRQLQKKERQKSRIVLKIVMVKCVKIKLENLYTKEIQSR